jgi:hypothetical protein
VKRCSTKVKINDSFIFFYKINYILNLNNEIKWATKYTRSYCESYHKDYELDLSGSSLLSLSNSKGTKHSSTSGKHPQRWKIKWRPCSDINAPIKRSNNSYRCQINHRFASQNMIKWMVIYQKKFLGKSQNVSRWWRMLYFSTMKFNSTSLEKKVQIIKEWRRISCSIKGYPIFTDYKKRTVYSIILFWE